MKSVSHFSFPVQACMSAYTPEPAALDPRPLLPTPYAAHDDDDNERVVIRMGDWDTGLFHCLDSWVNCCTVWWLPCVSLAQISQRIGWAPYWKVLQIMIAIYIVEIILASIVSLSVHTTLRYSTVQPDFEALYEAHPKLVATASVVSVVASACSFLGSLSGLVMIIITWSLRSRIREMFRIPGSATEDGLVSVCCSPCTVAQMATHVKTYKKGNCDIGPVDTLPGYTDLPQHHPKPAK